MIFYILTCQKHFNTLELVHQQIIGFEPTAFWTFLNSSTLGHHFLSLFRLTWQVYWKCFLFLYFSLPLPRQTRPSTHCSTTKTKVFSSRRWPPNRKTKWLYPLEPLRWRTPALTHSTTGRWTSRQTSMTSWTGSRLHPSLLQQQRPWMSWSR